VLVHLLDRRAASRAETARRRASAWKPFGESGLCCSCLAALAVISSRTAVRIRRRRDSASVSMDTSFPCIRVSLPDLPFLPPLSNGAMVPFQFFNSDVFR